MMYKVILTIGIFILINSCQVFASPTTYTVINEIYPFTEPNEVMSEIVKVMDSQKNVCLCIMPIYRNADYPAFYEFASLIYYAQQKGCHVMLHYPLIYKDEPTVEEIEKIVRDNIDIYDSFGISIEGVIYEDGDKHAELASLISHNVRLIELKDEDLTKVMIDSTAYKTFEVEHLPTPEIKCKVIIVPKQYDFQRGIMDHISYNLEKTNSVLLVIVSISIVSFLIMMIYARRLNYKKFVGKKGDK